MRLEHFSHDHPLNLSNVEKIGGEEEVVCHGCQKPISGSAYSCIRECRYFLHKECVELPKKITHPMHSEHPLTLLPRPNRSCICNVCHNGEWKWFTYNCFQCDFNVHISCAFKEQSAIQFESHKHPLTFMPRLALFYCDGCGTEGKDFSYRCTVCPFWIHESCALSPINIERRDHDHALVLAYSLPNTRRDCEQFCNICHKTVNPLQWVYYCDTCGRYYAHLKCATLEAEALLLRDDEIDIKVEEYLRNPMHFPLKDESVNLISQVFKEINLGSNTRATELNHFSHEHPLILSDVQTMNDEIICDGCVRPISIPFYSCNQCNFFLHKNCAELPEELHHPCHRQHPLHLQMSSKYFSSFWCRSCKILCNGLAFWCDSCNFYLDVNCASTFLPKKIIHEAHQHLLFRFETKALVSGNQCTACGKVMQIYPTFMFGCDTCGSYLDDYCAMLPRTVRHKWDAHPLTLTYRVLSDSQGEFCEICEEDIHSEYWFYHCAHCKQSFHTKCVRPFDTYSNIKFGGLFKVEYHPHTLTFVRRSDKMSPSQCNRCRERVDGIPVLECANCNFLLCLNCAESRSERVSLVPALDEACEPSE